MDSGHESALPIERVIAYIAGLMAVGWLAGFFAWGMTSSLAPRSVGKNQKKDFTDWGSGLAGLAGAAWFLSEWAFY